MPLLSEVLTFAMQQRHSRVSLQPKDGCTAAAVRMVLDMKATAWVGFNDGNLEKMTLVKKLEPAIPVFWDRPAKCDLQADLRIAKERGFESLVIHKDGVTQERIRLCHEAGLKMGSWTVNDRSQMQLFLSWGIDRIYTDDPAALLEVKQKTGAPVGKPR